MPIPGWSRVAEARWYGEIVREKERFALRQLIGRRVRGTYRPAAADKVRVVIRLGTGDLWVLHEVWRRGEYSPPPEAEAILRAAQPLRFVELGGHVGLFGAFVTDRYPGVQITSFEPDPANASVLRDCIRHNGAGEHWQLIEACAAAADGTVTFAAGQGGESHVAGPGEGRLELPAVDALPYVQGADFVKLDIEGSEWPILADPRFAADPPRVLVMEWHSVGAPEDNPKRAAVAALEPLGFRVHHPPPFDELPMAEPLWGAGVLWAWRP
jgi:FkbM family methyltransferase